MQHYFRWWLWWVALFFAPSWGESKGTGPVSIITLTTSFSKNIHPDPYAFRQSEKPALASDNDFPPGLAFFALIFLGFLTVFIGFGAVLAVAVLFALFAFTAWGIISVSVIVGLYQRSFRKGFRMFLLGVGGGLGVIVSTVGWWILVRAFHLPYNSLLAFLLAAGAGLLSGLFLGIMTERITSWLLSYFKRQLFNTND